VADEPRKRLRRLHVYRIVHCHQRLQRSVGAVAAQRAHLAVRGIESDHRGIRTAAPPLGVETAPILVLSLAGLPIQRAAESRPQVEGRLERPRRRSVQLLAQQSARGQHLVAHHLGGRPMPRAAREQPVVGIRRQRLRRHTRALAVGRRGDEQPQELLLVPASRDHLGGQPIKQLRMRRQLTLRTEFLACADEAGAENRLPQAVDEHARREGIRGVDQPAGQPHPVGRRPGRQRMKRGRHARLHLIAKREVVATKLHMRLPPLVGRQLPHDRGRGRLLSFDLLAQRGETAALLGQLGRHLSHIVAEQPLVLLRRAFHLGATEQGQLGGRRPHDIGDPRLLGQADAKMIQRGLRHRRLLLDRHHQPFTLSQHHGLLRLYHQRVRVLFRSAHCPAFARRRLLSFRRAGRLSVADHQRSIIAGLVEIRRGHRERDVQQPADLGRLIRTRSLTQGCLENRLPLRIERDDPQPRRGRFLSQTPPNHHALDRKRGAEIQLPPGVVASRSLRD